MDYTAIEWSTSALLVIDMQNDFVDGAMPVAETKEVLPQVAAVVAAFREASRPIAHIIRLYEPGGSDVDLVRRRDIEGGFRAAAPGSSGAAIPTSLTQGCHVELDTDHLLAGGPQGLSANEAIFYKPRWSAFFRTKLLEWLTARGVTSVVVAGCNLPNCPRATLFDASERDLRAALIADATSQVTQERLTDLGLIGVHTHTAKEAQSALRGGANH